MNDNDAEPARGSYRTQSSAGEIMEKEERKGTLNPVSGLSVTGCGFDVDTCSRALRSDVISRITRKTLVCLDGRYEGRSTPQWLGKWK